MSTTMEVNNTAGKIATEGDIKNLSEGFLAIYQEPLSKVSTNLKELTMKQTALIEAVSNQNQRLQSTQNNEVLKAMFSDVTYCREQLTTIKKQMTALHERSNRLRVRAQNVVTYAKNRQKTRAAELDNEQKLIGGHKS